VVVISRGLAPIPAAFVIADAGCLWPSRVVRYIESPKSVQVVMMARVVALLAPGQCILSLGIPYCAGNPHRPADGLRRGGTAADRY
jgi:hypothetical protein